jgi:hypothetical protein
MYDIHVFTHTTTYTVSHNCFYYTSKPECAIPDDNDTYTYSVLYRYVHTYKYSHTHTHYDVTNGYST